MRGISQSQISSILYETIWDDVVMTIDVVDEFLDEIGVDSRYIDQVSYHHILKKIGVDIPALDLDMVYAIMVEVGFDTSTVVNATIEQVLATIDMETLVIDAVGILEFFTDLGVDTTDVPLQAIIDVLDYSGFHVINPNAELEALGLDPEIIRSYFS